MPVDLSLPRLPRFRRAAGGFIAQTRCLNHCPALPVSPRISTPRRGFCFPSGSKRSIRFGPGQARFPSTPDLPSLPAANLFSVWLRINVPGPLCFRKLAVPQTSWNLLHHAPGRQSGQTEFSRGKPFSSGQSLRSFIRLSRPERGRNVEKTRCYEIVFGRPHPPGLVNVRSI